MLGWGRRYWLYYSDGCCLKGVSTTVTTNLTLGWETRTSRYHILYLIFYRGEEMVIFWYDRFWNKSNKSWFSQKFANRKKLHLQTFSLTRRSDHFWNYLSWRIIFLFAASVWESPSFLMTLRGIAEWNRLSCLPDGEKGSSSDEELKRVEDKSTRDFHFVITNLEYLKEGGEFIWTFGSW